MTRPRPTLLGRCWVLWLLSTGCVTSGLLTGARTLDPGQTELTAAPEVALAGSTAAGTPLAHLTVVLRHAIGEGVDVGGRAWALPLRDISVYGLGADLKVQLLRSESKDWGVDLALDPGAGYQVVLQDGVDQHVAAFQVPLIVGFNVPGGHQFVVAPTFMHQVAISTGAATVHFPFIGSTAAFHLQATDVLRIGPEVSLLWSPTTTEGTNGTWIARAGVAATVLISE